MTCLLCAGAPLRESPAPDGSPLSCPAPRSKPGGSAAPLGTVGKSPQNVPLDGVAGASARREHQRRQAKRDAAVRTKHPRVGGLILALTDEPQSPKAWEHGAVGEERLAQ